MSLFKKIIGTEEYNKIGIHLVNGCVSEISNGRLTVEQAVDILNLDTSDSSDLIRMLNHLATVPNKITTSSRIFNYLCMGELKVTEYRDYTDEALFWEMVEAE